MLWAQVPVVQYGVMMTGSMVHGKKSGRTAAPAAVLSWGGGRHSPNMLAGLKFR